MTFSLIGLPARRPTATAMFFLALMLFGLFAWYRVPVELVPALTGDQLFVSFWRPGSEPDVVEREILLPLEARVGELSGLSETWGEINGGGGRLRLRFERGANVKVRELELTNIAAELARTQPQGTSIRVTSQDLTSASRFVMTIQITGGEDRNALRDLVDVRIQPSFAAVPGVSQVLANGGAPREVTVWIDPERCAALGVRPEQVMRLLNQSVRPLRSLGGAEQHGRRWQIVLDGRPGGLERLGELRIDLGKPVLLRHVADIEMTTAQINSAFRINGRDAAALVVFQEDGANLLRLGRELRALVETMRAQWNPYGIDFRIGFDAAETAEKQIDRLQHLAMSGFAIALIVLYLFLREWRAVAVIAVAGPVSLLIAGAMLYLGGYTLNLVTMLGLVVGMGMLIDNSIVVFEAVQRGLERGMAAGIAALAGIRRTVRAIVTASLANVVVFLPAMFLVEDSITRGALELVAVGILLPLFASLIVAVGLVPLLAEKLAAPAAIARIEQRAKWRQERGGAVPPQRVRALSSALLKSALRRPTAWIASVAIAIFLTLVIALPWVIVGSQGREPRQADQVTTQIDLEGGMSIAAATSVFERGEQAVLALEGIELVETNLSESGGSLTVHFDPDARASGGATPAQVRNEVQKAVAGLERVKFKTVRNADGSSGGQEAEDAEVLISGPDMAQLNLLAREIQSRLTSTPDIAEAWVSSRAGREEVRIEPLPTALAPHRLYPEDVLDVLILSRREGLRLPVGFTLADGRELPLTVRRPEVADAKALQIVEKLRFATEAGSLRLGDVTSARRVTPATSISHHNGRRELAVGYTLDAAAPAAGPARVALEKAIQDGVREVYRPPGYTIEAISSDDSTKWLTLVFVPILLLLFAVLAIAFESLTMPILVLVAVPLTALGATWALAFAGVGVNMYALVGVIALLGLTVNPAILLVDRMQQRMRTTGCSGGAAAIAAARERTRPVLMTSCVTIAGLWPLSLANGNELEIWPPFAAVVMGGLVTSTLLTLLVIPVGFVLLSRIERMLGRLGPWVLLGWIATTAAVVAPLVLTDRLNTLTWQIITTVLIAGGLLGLMLRFLDRQPTLEMDAVAPPVETRFLSKVYGLPGPIAKAWRRGRDVDGGAQWTHRREASERALALGLLCAGSAYLASHLELLIWRVVFAYLCAAFASRAVIELRNVISALDASATDARSVRREKFDKAVLAASPFCMLAVLYLYHSGLPLLRGEPATVPAVVVVLLAIITLIAQMGRATARRAALAANRDESIGRMRALWRQMCMALFGLALPRLEVEALATTSFAARRGMIGILGPNGAGKTTMLRLLAGVLDASSGTVHYGGFLKRRAGDYVSRWVGYLPQEFGLPDHLTAQEYLEYFALLYRVGDRATRAERVERLLVEVGLHERRHDKIGGYSGGMRQRVAIARTLLRHPPIVIVDEPTVGLDPRERIRFRNLLAKLAEGRVVLFSTHVVEDVAVSCNRVVVMKRGRMVFDGPPDQLAKLAEHRTWELRLAAGAQVELPASCKMVDQGPEADGGSRMRILSAASPHSDAVPVEPGIEDGYLQLMQRGPENHA
jgi:multidrug efflux pump subunit AcrB/ABC-type multidrug transport system ATPase subunit